MSASQQELTPADLAPAIAKILRFREQYPEASRYLITTEQEAQEILIAMSATLDKASEALTVPREKAALITQARLYREAVKEGRARALFRSMTEEDQLEIFGLELAVTLFDQQTGATE